MHGLCQFEAATPPKKNPGVFTDLQLNKAHFQVKFQPEMFKANGT